MKKINLITGSAIHHKMHYNNISYLELFFKKMKDKGFVLDGSSFAESLFLCVKKILNNKKNTESLLDSYQDKILIVRDCYLIQFFPTENYSYNILRIKDDKNNFIYNPSLRISEEEKLEAINFIDKNEKILFDFLSKKENIFKTLEISIQDITAEFNKISDFFSNLNNI